MTAQDPGSRNHLLLDGELVKLYERDRDGRPTVIADIVVDLTEVERSLLEMRHARLWAAPVAGIRPAEFHPGPQRCELVWPAPGRPASARLRAEEGKGALDAGPIRRIGRRLAETLGRLHEQGLCHGWVLPELVWLSETASASPDSVTLLGGELGPLLESARGCEAIGPAHRATREDKPGLRPADDARALARLLLELLLGSDRFRALGNGNGDWPERVGRHAGRGRDRRKLAERLARLANPGPDEAPSLDRLRACLDRPLDPPWRRVLRPAIAGPAALAVALVAVLSTGWSLHRGQSGLGRDLTRLVQRETVPRRDWRDFREEVMQRLPEATNPPPVSEVVGEIWRKWLEQEHASVEDLHAAIEDDYAYWRSKYGKPFADRVEEDLYGRLRDAGAAGQWKATIEGVEGLIKPGTAIFLELEVGGRRAWSEVKLTRNEEGEVELAGGGNLPSFEWKPGEPITFWVEGPGNWTTGWIGGTNLFRNRSEHPLALWLLGRVHLFGEAGEAPPRGRALTAKQADGGKPRIRLTIEPAFDQPVDTPP